MWSKSFQKLLFGGKGITDLLVGLALGMKSVVVCCAGTTEPVEELVFRMNILVFLLHRSPLDCLQDLTECYGGYFRDCRSKVAIEL